MKPNVEFIYNAPAREIAVNLELLLLSRSNEEVEEELEQAGAELVMLGYYAPDNDDELSYHVAELCIRDLVYTVKVYDNGFVEPVGEAKSVLCWF